MSAGKIIVLYRNTIAVSKPSTDLRTLASMNTPTLSEIKQELLTLPASGVMELLIRLIRSRKENKELISYLIFESHNETGYVERIKEEIDEAFSVLPATTNYLTKKGLRKILRSVATYTRQMGSKQAEVEMLIYFCGKFKTSGIHPDKNSALENIFLRQIKKLNSLIDFLHEDLRHDYKRVLDEL